MKNGGGKTETREHRRERARRYRAKHADYHRHQKAYEARLKTGLTAKKEAEAKEALAGLPGFPLPYLFTFRHYQKAVEEAFQTGIRRFITIWPRGGGKDNFWLNFIAKRMQERVGTYYHVYPELNMGRRNLWEAYSNDGFRFLDHFPRELCVDNGQRGRNRTEMTVTFINGSKYQVMGADEPDRLRGGNPIGVAFSEYAWTARSAWPIIQPRIIQNKGWVSFNSTPDGRDEALYPLWKNSDGDKEWYRSIETGKSIFKDGGIWKYSVETDSWVEEKENGEPVYTDPQIDELRRSGRSEDWIAQEIFCSFNGSRVGAYYGQWITRARSEGRIKHGVAPWDPRYGVSVVFDLGFTDYTCIWFFQRWGQRINVIDYFQDSGQPFGYYVKVMREKPYRYNRYWAPHDVHQHHGASGKSTYDVARDCGITFDVVPNLPLTDGINAVRALLPRCFFEEPNCGLGVECLERYRAIFNKRLEEQGTHPVHDKYSHGADAFRYLALVVDEDQGENRRVATMSDGEFEIFP